MTPYTQALAEQASTEMNPAKLMTLVSELCRALDDERAQPRGCSNDCGEQA